MPSVIQTFSPSGVKVQGYYRFLKKTLFTVFGFSGASFIPPGEKPINIAPPAPPYTDNVAPSRPDGKRNSAFRSPGLMAFLLYCTYTSRDVQVIDAAGGAEATNGGDKRWPACTSQEYNGPRSCLRKMGKIRPFCHPSPFPTGSTTRTGRETPHAIKSWSRGPMEPWGQAIYSAKQRNETKRKKTK